MNKPEKWEEKFNEKFSDGTGKHPLNNYQFSEIYSFISTLIEQTRKEERDRFQSEIEKLQSAYDHYENDKAWNALQNLKEKLSHIEK